MLNSKFQAHRLRTDHGEFICQPVIGYFDVITHGKLPFAQFTIKVVQYGINEFQATPNVVVYNSSTKGIEHTCGLGQGIEEAIVDAVNMFFLRWPSNRKINLTAIWTKAISYG